MKVYFHLCVDGFTNSYTILNDDSEVMEAIIVDPGKISMETINLIEQGGYKLVAVLITHNHKNHVQGLKTLKKIYSPTVFSADTQIYDTHCFILNGDGIIRIANFNVEFYSVIGHSADSMVYKIEDLVFTGDTLLPGVTGSTLSQYSHKLLCSKIRDKILSMPNKTIILPGHGAPGTVESEKQYNLDVGA